ncbi:MAG TPA: hypothetical protein VM935_12650 [Chitinophagaceae bacterium]|jgi:hypothetical protein|nr:hypothetical protein [Chitinophagaceae bacterium]
MVNCICINDEDKPIEIPQKKWVVKDEEYRITHVYFHPNQGLQGCTLYEKPLDETCKPFETFKLSRFAIKLSDLEAFIELCKLCTELNELQIKELIEESELQTV